MHYSFTIDGLIFRYEQWKHKKGLFIIKFVRPIRFQCLPWTQTLKGNDEWWIRTWKMLILLMVNRCVKRVLYVRMYLFQHVYDIKMTWKVVYYALMHPYHAIKFVYLSEITILQISKTIKVALVVPPPLLPYIKNVYIHITIIINNINKI